MLGSFSVDLHLLAIKDLVRYITWRNVVFFIHVDEFILAEFVDPLCRSYSFSSCTLKKVYQFSFAFLIRFIGEINIASCALPQVVLSRRPTPEWGGVTAVSPPELLR